MKKLMLLAMMAFFTVTALVGPSLFHANDAKAQLVVTLKPEAANDTLTDADTATIYINATARSTGDTLSTSVVDGSARSVTIYGKTVSGNPSSSRAYLKASVDGVNYTTLDSLVFTNTTYNFKTFPLRSNSGAGDLLYRTWRVDFYNAPTSVVVPKVYYLRRSN